MGAVGGEKAPTAAGSAPESIGRKRPFLSREGSTSVGPLLLSCITDYFRVNGRTQVFFDPPGAFVGSAGRAQRNGCPAYPDPSWFKALRFAEYRDHKRENKASLALRAVLLTERMERLRAAYAVLP